MKFKYYILTITLILSSLYTSESAHTNTKSDQENPEHSEVTIRPDNALLTASTIIKLATAHSGFNTLTEKKLKNSFPVGETYSLATACQIFSQLVNWNICRNLEFNFQDATASQDSDNLSINLSLKPHIISEAGKSERKDPKKCIISVKAVNKVTNHQELKIMTYTENQVVIFKKWFR